MRVLIVGCGYVGLPLGAELVRRGHEVWGMRRGHASDTELRSAGIRTVVGDITQPRTFAGLPQACDWVINCVSAGGAEAYHPVYVEGNRNLLQWLADSPPQRLVYTSSTGVYGQTDGSRVDEASPTEPAAETGRMLVAAEKILQAAGRQSGPAVIILRVAGIYGPGRGYWLKQYLRGEARIEGKGERILNMIHRDDVAGAMVATLERGQPGEVYNVVDDEPVRQIDMFNWLAAKLGRGVPPIFEKEATPVRLRGVTNKMVTNRRLKHELDYRLKFPTFREGFASEIGTLTASGITGPAQDKVLGDS